MNRLLYVCLDGLGDDPVPELGDRTPLEAAKTPVLDSLARRGRTGTVITVGEGIAPESDIAVFAILGYDPHEEHPGRGVVEAIGSADYPTAARRPANSRLSFAKLRRDFDIVPRPWQAAVEDIVTTLLVRPEGLDLL